MAIPPDAPPFMPEIARRLAEAASAFVDSLGSSQQTRACFAFQGDERYQWTYTPGPRSGLPLQAMSQAQRAAALRLIDATLSARGAATAHEIIALETLLRETERIEQRETGDDRNPELYYFSLFGMPGGSAPWGWRANGHHLALNFTIVASQQIVATPLFFGANPAEMRHGAARGLRVLAAEEDLARSLLTSLNAHQKAVAIVDPSAPSDILTRNYRVADPSAVPQGIRSSDLSGEQRGQLMRVIRQYVERVDATISTPTLAQIEQASHDQITFAWAGAEERGKPHYYAIKGSSFLIEYDNSQNDANHIHSVWRDLAHDWGEDLLAAHYADAHGTAAHPNPDHH